jgi:(1->4)-alpha-D-glucan 1-alpha-D-glucosylmutase
MINNAFYRPQGLDFSGQLAAMKYAAKLGINSLHTPPVLDSESFAALLPDGTINENRHGYGQRRHDLISPDLGGLTKLLKLSAFVEGNGGQVLVDWVANHTANDHVLFRSEPWAYDWFVDPLGQPLIDALGHKLVDANGRPFYASFFGLDILPKLRIEDPIVFQRTQGYILSLAKQHGWLLRADHFDGFQDPFGVVAWLRALGLKVLAEKIVAEGEDFATDETLLGETGYRTADWLNRLFYRQSGVTAITQHWIERVHQDPVLSRFRELSWDEMSNQAKYEGALLHFPGDIQRLLADLRACGHGDVTAEDVARWCGQLQQYRTYGWHGREPSIQDKAAWEHVHAPEWFKQGMMRGRWPYFLPVLSGIFAKTIEDRTLYQYTPIPGLNEVGGTPWRGWLSTEEFHHAVGNWSLRHPSNGTMLAGHDFKHGPLYRKANAAATLMADEYISKVDALTAIAQEHNPGSIGPRAMRYVIDTILSAWPIDAARLNRFVGKAWQESGLERSWFPWLDHPEFGAESDRFVCSLLGDKQFIGAAMPMALKMDTLGRELLLSEQLLALFIPGTFCFYNGAELPANAKQLVDPDNRKPADFELLSNLADSAAEGRLESNGHDLRQMALIRKTLGAINASGKFSRSQWEPVEAKPNQVAVRRGDLMAIVSLDGSSIAKEGNLLPLTGQWLGKAS